MSNWTDDIEQSIAHIQSLIQQTIQVSEFCSVKIKRVANIFSTIRRRTQEQSQCLCEKSATALHDRG